MKICRCLPSVCRILRDASHHDGLESRRQLTPQVADRCRLVVELRSECLLRRHSAERRLSGEQFVGDEAERVNVSAMIDRGICDSLLGRHVCGRADCDTERRDDRRI